MAGQEHEITVEVVCTKLPGTDWDGLRTVHLGIQKDEDVEGLVPAEGRKIVFRPLLRLRQNTDGSPNFLGPFAQGPRSERFIYLVWAAMKGKSCIARPGRIKLHLNHIGWADVEKALLRKKP